MTEERLLDGAATEFEATLLKSAINELPTEQMSAKMLAPLAIGVGAAASASVTTASILKWAGAGAGALLLGGVVYLSETSRDVAPTPVESKVEAPSAPPALDAAAPGDRHESAQVEIDTPTLLEEPTTPSKSKAKAPAAQVPSTLADEMRLLDQARSLLKTNRDPEGALQVLSRYEKKYPDGKLRPEATVLRVAALKESGAQEKATELKDEFLKAHPTSAHKKQLEAKDDPSP